MVPPGLKEEVKTMGLLLFDGLIVVLMLGEFLLEVISLLQQLVVLAYQGITRLHGSQGRPELELEELEFGLYQLIELLILDAFLVYFETELVCQLLVGGGAVSERQDWL